MTPIGQYTIDLFSKSLVTLLTNNKKHKLSNQKKNRNIEILQKCYDFDKNSFAEFLDLANEYNLTKTRIVQIHDSTFQKIVALGKNGNTENTTHKKLINFIDNTFINYRDKEKRIHIVLFWNEHLPEFSGEVVVRLLAHLFFDEKKDRLSLINIYKKWRTTEYKKRLKKERIFQLMQHKQSYMLRNVVWFENRKKWNLNGKELIPKRQIDLTNSKFISGNFRSKKCNREVQYESSLELDFITLIEQFPKITTYVEQPVTIEYDFNGKSYKYTPDFAVFLESNEGFIVEVKDFTGMVDAKVQRKLEALIEYCKKHGFGMMLTDGKDFIDKLIRHPFNQQFEKDLQQRLSQRESGIMFFKEFKAVREKHDAMWIELLVIVLKNNWCLYPFPFKLIKNNSRKKFRKTIVSPFLS